MSAFAGQIVSEPIDGLQDYGLIPIRYQVKTVLALQLREDGFGHFALQEQKLEQPWIKDYDIEGNRPTDWARTFDMGPWQRLGAYLDGRRVGAALMVQGSPELHMLEQRSDLAVLWDIRVDPAVRGQGVGQALFAACEAWARIQGCSQLKIETQNVNVPACRFYKRMGCELGAIHRFAYPEFPDEVQLMWYKKLGPTATP